MTIVLFVGTTIATVAYIVDGIFGATTWSKYPNVAKVMDAQNILKNPYGSLPTIEISLIFILLVVLFASPFCILPCKDSIE